MLCYYVFILLICLTHATISAAEAELICKYSNVSDFPIPCSDAINACGYTGIVCSAVTGGGFAWNETITSFDMFLSFPGNTTEALPTELGNLASLQYFRLISSGKMRASSIPTELGLCKQLESFSLIVGAIGGSVPAALFAGTNLSYLEILNSGLTGTLPTTLSLLTRLTYLSLPANQFSGALPSFSALTRLDYVDLSYNQFTGLLPDTASLPLLNFFDVANNRFHGDIPPFLSPTLVYVDLSHNLLNGSFSSSSSSFTGTQPFFFTANANQVTGTIPSAFFTPFLISLDLSYNALSGTLPKEVATNTGMLEQLVLSHNLLSGSLATEWQGANFNALFRLGLDHNAFDGTVPSFSVGTGGTGGRRSVQYEPHIYINMNNNLFTGVIPSFPAFPTATSMDLSTNALSVNAASFGTGGNISWLNLAHNPLLALPPYLFTNIETFLSLVSLDLSHCQIAGTLPEFFSLQYLELNNNYFTGVVRAHLIYQLDDSKLPVFADIRLNRLDTDATRQSHIGSVSAYLNGEIVLTDFPQDVDECLLNTHACEYLCVDGWFPVPGYTCACPPGFKLDEVNRLNCTAVCGDGLLSWPEEACDYEYSKVGCYRDCTVKQGYVCNAAGCAPICGDGVLNEPEECDNTRPGCNQRTCTVEEGYTCSTAENTCQSCSQSWLPFLYTPNLRLFPHLRAVIGDDLTDFHFASCIACEDGVALQTRAVLATNQCNNMSTQRELPCSFACTNLTVFSSATESIYTLQSELLKGSFIQQLFRVIFNLNVTVTTNIPLQGKKRVDPVSQEIAFTLSPCVSDKTAIVDVLRALTLDVVPNLPNMAISSSGCGVTIRSTNPPPETLMTIVLVISVTALLVVIASVLCVAYYYRSSELHQLPSDISWSFLHQRLRPWAWEWNGNKTSGYYSREYHKHSEDYRKVESLLTTHFKKGHIEIEGITAVYNPALSTSFINQVKLMTTRKLESEDMFFARTYTRDPEKMKVMAYIEKDLLQFTPYNQELAIPLIPVLHGTDLTTARCIAQTGFAALSSLDEGFYGKGIYFTTSLPYTLPYACNKRRPSVIISYINIGNPWPTTEAHDSSKSLKGAAIKNGYNSHICLTGKRGSLYTSRDDVLCDEFVIPQESQILPAFLIELSIESCTREFEKWNRSVPLPVADAAIKEFQIQQGILSKYTSLESVVSFHDGSAPSSFVLDI